MLACTLSASNLFGNSSSTLNQKKWINSCFSILSLLLASRSLTVNALFEDETGVNDLLLATTGHGAVDFVHATEDAVLTSGTTPCFVASRSLEAGELLWRRNICETTTSSSTTSIAVGNDRFVTADGSGILRTWTLEEGALLWDAPPSGTIRRVFAPVGVAGAIPPVVAATSKEGGKPEVLTVHNAVNGRVMGKLSAADVGSNLNAWLDVFVTHDGVLGALLGAVVDENSAMIVKADPMVFAQLDLNSDGSVVISRQDRFSRSSSSLLASSIVSKEVGKETLILGSSMDGTVVSFSLQSKLSNSYPSSEKFAAIENCGTMTLAAHDKSLDLYLIEDIDTHLALPERAALLESKVPVAVVGSIPQLLDRITDISVLQCKSSEAKFLVTTVLGSTKAMKFSVSGDNAKFELLWQAEEGMKSVSSAVLIDPSHALIDSEDEDSGSGLLQLDLSSRLQSQLEAVTSLLFDPTSLAMGSTRDEDFGFVKVALLLSIEYHRLWGVPTAGSQRGSVAWTITLPEGAEWHTVVYGLSSGTTMHDAKAMHSHDALVLSKLQSTLEWKCLDGIHGKIQSTGTAKLSGPVAQVIPIFSSLGDLCHQGAFVFQKDRTFTVVPETAEWKAAAIQQIQAYPNGFFTHSVETEAGALETYQLSYADDAFQVRLAGQAKFPGEIIVRVAYPQREEAIQSPVTVLGDDSLLLKYLNPHVAVVVTTSASEGEEDSATNGLLAAINPSNSAGKKKPQGVSPSDGTDATEGATGSQVDTPPNLFINVIDTVSARVLHRASHANAVIGNGSTYPVIISENWIVYAFLNKKTRRTELGVLTLHEGMIDKEGVTAFTSPEQVLSFSSLEAREAKPVILAKTYAVVKKVTALGVTMSKGGISTKHILLASEDDRITSMNRGLLEPRRPTGELKPHEKEEGLFKYSPLVPLVSMSSPSYNQTVQGVTTILSAPTDLESQSLILAYGGPDIFCTRVSPSKGFDLLPDSFNRPLLIIIVVGLLVGLGVMRRMSTKRLINTGWY